MNNNDLETIAALLKTHALPIEWRPVLTTRKDAAVDLHLLNTLSIEKINIKVDTAYSDSGLDHFAVVNSDLCHKRKTIHLFVIANDLIKRNSPSSIWLHENNREPVVPAIVNGHSILTPPIQIFLAHAGFNIFQSDENALLSPHAFSALFDAAAPAKEVA